MINVIKYGLKPEKENFYQIRENNKLYRFFLKTFYYVRFACFKTLDNV